jgi:hypothetical protein
MAKTTKNIQTLNHEEAMEFFMKSEQYHGFELPLRLCKLVMGNIDEPLWNNGLIKAEFVLNMPNESIVDKGSLKKVTSVITFRETRAYYEHSISQTDC